ncbi:hemagglutinin/amebocyte aggregation factor-like [Lissotriton helveticus]
MNLPRATLPVTMRALVLLAATVATVFAESEAFQGAPTEESEYKLSPRWQNGYDQPLLFTCPGQDSISSIISQHHNTNEDRVWDFTCKYTFSGSTSCHWSPYVNNFDEEFTYTCPFGSVISGFDSYHDNRPQDRRWKVYCCIQKSDMTSDCQWTNYVNDFDAYFNWQVPNGRYLVGVSSYHSNNREDRRWKYQHCAIRA